MLSRWRVPRPPWHVRPYAMARTKSNTKTLRRGVIRFKRRMGRNTIFKRFCLCERRQNVEFAIHNLLPVLPAERYVIL